MHLQISVFQPLSQHQIRDLLYYNIQTEEVLLCSSCILSYSRSMIAICRVARHFSLRAMQSPPTGVGRGVGWGGWGRCLGFSDSWKWLHGRPENLLKGFTAKENFKFTFKVSFTNIKCTHLNNIAWWVLYLSGQSSSKSIFRICPSPQKVLLGSFPAYPSLAGITIFPLTSEILDLWGYIVYIFSYMWFPSFKIIFLRLTHAVVWNISSLFFFAAA